MTFPLWLSQVGTEAFPLLLPLTASTLTWGLARNRPLAQDPWLSRFFNAFDHS